MNLSFELVHLYAENKNFHSIINLSQTLINLKSVNSINFLERFIICI